MAGDLLTVKTLHGRGRGAMSFRGTLAKLLMHLKISSTACQTIVTTQHDDD